MKIPFEFFVSLRYLRAKRKYGLFNISISIAGVALGVMALIVVLAVMSGFEKDMKSKIIGMYSEITISTGALMPDYQSVIEKAEQVPGVLAATPAIHGQVMIKSMRRARGVAVRGIDPEREAMATAIEKYIERGDLPKAGQGVIIGDELASSMDLRVGDIIKIISPVEVDTPAGPVPLVLERRIVGIFNSGMFEYDSNLIYVDLKTAQKLFRYGDAVHEVSVHIKDIDMTEAVSAELEKVFQRPYKVSSWVKRNPSLFAAVRMEKKMMFFIVALIVLVAALNIASTLIMVVMEKTKDIGILKAIGVRQRSIMSIFTMEGAIIGVTGAIIGVAAGILFADNINAIADCIGSLTGFQPFRRDIYFLDRIPVELSFARISITAAIAIILSTLAAIYPAWRAASVNPVEALRYE